MKQHYIHFLIVILVSIVFGCSTSVKVQYSIPSEFEEQEYIWLTWVESGFLGGEPFYVTALNAMKEIIPYAKVRLCYSPQLTYNRDQMKTRIYEKLIENRIDTSRVTLFYSDKTFAAIQDPGPIFLRNAKGELAVADFKFRTQDKPTESIDRNVAARLNLPVISSNMITEGAHGKQMAKEPRCSLNRWSWTEINQ